MYFVTEPIEIEDVRDWPILKRHAFNECLLPLPDAEFEKLRFDIQCNELMLPIVLYEGMILDGYHRQRAVLELGTLPIYCSYVGRGSAQQYLMSVNCLYGRISDNNSVKLIEVSVARARERRIQRV